MIISKGIAENTDLNSTACIVEACSDASLTTAAIAAKHAEPTVMYSADAIVLFFVLMVCIWFNCALGYSMAGFAEGDLRNEKRTWVLTMLPTAF
ncbi:MAG: hypothetical protein FWD57_03015 [Polyangiaceae bacterium]|nr:hypothetical protein [Polyangiaceae bacterium]